MIEKTYDEIKAAVEIFERYPENPEEHYKESIRDKSKIYHNENGTYDIYDRINRRWINRD